MHEFVRPVAAALSVVCLAAAIAIAFAGDALAQANPAPPNQTAPAPQAAPPQQPTVKPVKQMALTDKQIEGVLKRTWRRSPQSCPTIPRRTRSPRSSTASPGRTVLHGNIGIVLAGFDPATKQYVGTDAVIK